MTPEIFDRVTDCDEDFRYELIHGVVVVTSPPGEGERDPNEELGHLLRTYRDERPDAPFDRTLTEQTIRTPDSRRRADRVIWTGLGRRPDPRVDVPAIAIEFVSKRARDRRRDYDEKSVEYAAAGVREYWVIDRFRRIMTVFRDAGREPLVVEEAALYQTALLPGFQVPLARLLKLADDWTDVE